MTKVRQMLAVFIVFIVVAVIGVMWTRDNGNLPWLDFNTAPDHKHTVMFHESHEAYLARGKRVTTFFNYSVGTSNYTGQSSVTNWHSDELEYHGEDLSIVVHDARGVVTRKMTCGIDIDGVSEIVVARAVGGTDPLVCHVLAKPQYAHP